MVFCGQCGYQLPSGETRCLRCGSLVEANAAPTVPDYNPDAPTVEARSLNTQRPSPAAGAQQKLVLRPSEPDYSTQPGNEETTRAVTPAPGAGSWPATPTMQAPYPGYASQETYYPGSVPQRSPIDPSQGQEQPADYVGQYPPARRRSSVGRTVALMIILLGLLLIAGAMVLFALRARGIANNTNPTGSGTITATSSAPATATPSITSASVPPQALAVIQQYYSDINHHSYRAAYNLWKNNTQGFIAFRNGFKNTLRDQATPGSATMQADGTVKIPVTVNATQTTPAGIKHTIYQGYYIVGQQPDGSWQILSGYLTPA